MKVKADVSPSTSQQSSSRSMLQSFPSAFATFGAPHRRQHEPFTWRKHFSESSNNSQARTFLSQPPNSHGPPEKLLVPMVNTQNQTEIHSLHPFENRHTHTSPKLWHRTNFFIPGPLHAPLFRNRTKMWSIFKERNFSHPFYSGRSISFAYARKSGEGRAGVSGIWKRATKKRKIILHYLVKSRNFLFSDCVVISSICRTNTPVAETTVMGGWQRVSVLVVRFFPWPK